MTGQNLKNIDGKQKRLANLTNAGKGRPKGVLNKTTTQLKEAILEAATKAGGEEGLVGYLCKQADQNPQSFLPLLGKVLPMTLHGSGPDGEQVVRVEIVGVQP